MSVTVIIPAHDEGPLIKVCLAALIEGTDRATARNIKIIVLANACSDNTASQARTMRAPAKAAGILLEVIETPIPGKAQALNLADQSCDEGVRVYLDADVICASGMLSAIVAALDTPHPRFASGQIEPVSDGGFFSRSYGFVWNRLPFVKSGVCGCGLYAVNAAGRRRWKAFPLIHSDDRFARLNFSPAERIKVDIDYRWPLPKNLRELITVRSRWCRGNSEVEREFRHLLENDQTRKPRPLWVMRLGLQHPVKCSVFLFVYLAAMARAVFHNDSRVASWERSR